MLFTSHKNYLSYSSSNTLAIAHMAPQSKIPKPNHTLPTVHGFIFEHGLVICFKANLFCYDRIIVGSRQCELPIIYLPVNLVMTSLLSNKFFSVLYTYYENTRTCLFIALVW